MLYFYPVTVIIPITKSNLGKDRLYSSFQAIVHHGIAGAQNMGQMMLSCWPTGLCLASFLLQARTTIPGNAVAHSRLLPSALATQKSQKDSPTDPFDVGNPAIETPFLGAFRLSQVDN